ncbi:unnamed protein product, partial [Ectocarpus fasciculatus]
VNTELGVETKIKGRERGWSKPLRGHTCSICLPAMATSRDVKERRRRRRRRGRRGGELAAALALVVGGVGVCRAAASTAHGAAAVPASSAAKIGDHDARATPSSSTAFQVAGNPWLSSTTGGLRNRASSDPSRACNNNLAESRGTATCGTGWSGGAGGSAARGPSV